MSTLLAGLALSAGLAAGFWFGRRNARVAMGPALAELEAGISRWAQGDLGAELDRARLGERGALADAFAAARDGVFRLLGERKREVERERRRFDALVHNIPDGLILADLRGEVLSMNAAAARILGLKDDPAGKRPVDLVNTTEFRMKIQEILKSRTHHEVLELPMARAGGTTVGYFRTTVNLFSSPGGEDLGVMILMRDMTSERNIDSIKEEFFQNVAHDLRAPLFAMQGYLRLLEKSLSPDKHQKGYIDAITQSCEKLTLFIQDTLDAAKIEAGQFRLTTHTVETVAIGERVLRLFKPLADEKGVRLTLSRAQNTPAAIDCDERLVERVFYNLVGNALKFTPRDGAVTLELAAAGPDAVEFVVADTGPGIPAGQRAQVFEKFRQIDGGSKSGFGLGLNICQKIVQLHGGTIWVDSEPGMGSQFIFRLPTRQEKG